MAIPSQVPLFQIRQINGWGISNVQNPDTSVEGQRVSVNVLSQDDIDNADQPLYWIAPSDYHGNMVKISKFRNYC